MKEHLITLGVAVFSILLGYYAIQAIEGARKKGASAPTPAVV